MSGRHRLQKLLRNTAVGGRLWLAGSDHGAASRSSRGCLPTGFAELDRALAGGWPLGVLCELLVDSSGIGELQLLLPALIRLAGLESRAVAVTAPQSAPQLTPQARAKGGHWVMLIAPPHIPYAPAFVRHGLDLSRLLVVHCRRQAEVLWSAEQALQSGACTAILVWATNIDERALRRLQLAAEATRKSAGGCWLVLFRPLHYRQQRSPAALRVSLWPDRSSALRLHIFKNRGGRPRQLMLNPAAEIARAGAE